MRVYGGRKMNKKQSKHKEIIANTSYLSSIIVKAFLIAIFCIVGLTAIIFSCYYIDLLINVKNGKETNPLFSAYVIVSPSMVPTIDVNDAIVIKRIDNDKYNHYK